MNCTRRELLRSFWRPNFWTAPDDAGPSWPDGQDIVLRRGQCIAWGRGICNACEDVCPERAIMFVGGLHPRLLTARCTLCGDCVPACPAAAITIRPAALAGNLQGEAG